MGTGQGREKNIQKTQPGEEVMASPLSKSKLLPSMLVLWATTAGPGSSVGPAHSCLWPFPSGVEVGKTAVPSSPRHLHPTPQMTAWARWSWTSRRTSPSSPTRPASESEQTSATAGHKRGRRHPLPGWLFKKIDFAFWFVFPAPPPPMSSFFFSSYPDLAVLATLSWPPRCSQMSAGNLPKDGLLGGWREVINHHQPPRG